VGVVRLAKAQMVLPGRRRMLLRCCHICCHVYARATVSVSGQNLCLGMPANMGSAARTWSLMSATVRVDWPTVWPTANWLPLCPMIRQRYRRTANARSATVCLSTADG
jgi:hypothetical protein